MEAPFFFFKNFKRHQNIDISDTPIMAALLESHGCQA